MLTAYDYPLALLEEQSGVDIILVGDSLGMTVLGLETTLPVTMDIMIPHAQAVRRGAPTAYVIGDMPYMTYQVSKEEAIRNAGRFMQEAGTDAVKLEGGRNVAATVAAIVKATIPVMGHLGLTPQSLAQMGGYKVQGSDAESAVRLIEDAKMLEDAGISTLLLEAIPPEPATTIAERSSVPVISLGAGSKCHGCLQIVHDMLGFFDRFTPKFVKKYANLNEVIRDACKQYVADVQSKAYPQTEHCYSMRQGERARLAALLEESKKR
jgi:3-methyl-2-oxobutanoate hydroxymethyltransferase